MSLLARRAEYGSRGALSADASAGATNIQVQVRSVNGFTASDKIPVGAATNMGANVIPVAGGMGFSAGQTITIDSGANHETAVVASIGGGGRGGRGGGAAITVAAPLTLAHTAGAQVSGTGITLTSALTRPHDAGAQVASDVPTPGAPNKYSRRQ